MLKKSQDVYKVYFTHKRSTHILLMTGLTVV